jgi:hypothetical protein
LPFILTPDSVSGKIIGIGEPVRRMWTSPEEANLMEILDRVLDNGIVVEPAARVMLMGADLHDAKERMVIDSLSTYY